jgi:hypothetical protein
LRPVTRWHRETLVEMEDAPGVPHPTGWLVQKVLWKISRAYRGPVWIQGREIGGPGSDDVLRGCRRQQQPALPGEGPVAFGVIRSPCW